MAVTSMRTGKSEGGNGMKLYEIDQAIMDCVDQETGEIINPDLFRELVGKREEKIESVALWTKDIKGDIAKISEEVKRLEGRKKALENTLDSLKTYIDTALEGSKLKTPRISIYYGTSKSVEITNENDIPEEFFEVKKTPKKTAIGEALKAGIAVPGTALSESKYIVIK